MSDLLWVGPLSFEENGRLLYKDVTVILPEATLVVLTGPSGSGKTSLLRQMVGLIPAKGARRCLEGREYLPSDISRFRAEVLLLSCGAAMIAGTIWDNLTFVFGLKNRGDRCFDESRARELMEYLGLGYLRWSQRVRDLSLGERHRLALVRALLWDPKVLLADEPFTGLDPESYTRAFKLLSRQARRPGRASLCVIHEPVPKGVDILFRLESGGLKRIF